MADRLQIEIGLDGAEEVNQRLKQIEQTSAAATRGVVNFTSTVIRLGDALAKLAASATVAAGAAMVKFAESASQVEKSLTQLQAVTAQSFENLSAMQQVFAAGGTSAKDFASSMSKLAKSVDDVAQKIKAQNALEMFGPKQGKALIDWANDVDAISQQFAHLGEAVLGVGNRISNGLTTLDTQTKAVLNSLAKVSDPNERWLQLADILKSLSTADAAKIGENLGLKPEQINTLRQGSEILRALAEEAKLLGLTLTTANQQALQQMAQGWNQFSAFTSAALQKLGAAAAPAFAAIVAAANTATVQITQDFENMPLDQAIANIGNRLAPVFAQIANILGPVMEQVGVALGEALFRGILEQLGILAPAIRSAVQGASGSGGGSSSSDGGGGNSGMAGGGLIAGRGSGTSDSNLAWVSRGEHIMPAAAVARPGMLAFLEALRRSGGDLGRVLGMGALGPIRRFAEGGPVGPNLGTLHLALPGGGSVPVHASIDAVGQLRQAAALAQVRSGGRKPSRYS